MDFYDHQQRDIISGQHYMTEWFVLQQNYICCIKCPPFETDHILFEHNNDKQHYPNNIFVRFLYYWKNCLVSFGSFTTCFKENGNKHICVNVPVWSATIGGYYYLFIVWSRNPLIIL